MDGERRKRKKKNNAEASLVAAPPPEEKEEDDNELEEEMEHFFALVRSTRDVKERMLMSGSGNASNTLRALQPGEDVDGKKILGSENRQPSAVRFGFWNLTFQPEDFMDGLHPASPPDYHHHLESSSINPLNLNVNPTATHDEEEGGADAGGPLRTKPEEDRDEDDPDLDLNLSL